MKKVIFSWLLSLMFISTAMAQFGATRTGFEGDNFSLEGALELFKDSRSVQDFERRLNTKTNWVNNLDLDYNGRTDYIRVNHRRQGSLNAIILQVPVNRREIQDVAVIQIEQTGRRRALMQIVGDADLYGQNVIVEPYDNFGGTVNVYRWRAVRNMLDGFGSAYVSPYAFNNYPVWYSPWDQFAWNAYQPRISSFGRFYRVSPFNRLSNVYGFYSPYRAYCPAVGNRTAQVRTQQATSNRATATRSTATRTNRTTTKPSVRSSRSTATTRANTSRSKATTSRATTATTRRSTSTVNRRPAVRRSIPSRVSTSPRTSRTATTRATTQRRVVTPSRTRSTVQRTPSRPVSRTRTATPTNRRVNR